MGDHSFSSQMLMLNLQQALERVGGDEDLLREIARLFLDECPRLMTEIQQAIEAGDSRRMERAAHSLKGSVANFGAEPVVKAALDLETMGRAGDLARADQGFLELSRHLEKLQPQLASLASE